MRTNCNRSRQLVATGSRQRSRAAMLTAVSSIYTDGWSKRWPGGEGTLQRYSYNRRTFICLRRLPFAQKKLINQLLPSFVISHHICVCSSTTLRLLICGLCSRRVYCRGETKSPPKEKAKKAGNVQVNSTAVQQ